VRADDLGDVRRGDKVVFVPSDRLQPYQLPVTEAGPKWLTVSGRRFLRETGRPVSGNLDPHIESLASWEERREAASLTARLAPWGWRPLSGQHDMTVNQLRLAAALIERFEREARS
jgi:hypothetical protein